MQHQVIHQSQQQRFVIQLSQTQACLFYRLDTARHEINFYSTFVPEEARGLGLARRLTEAALAFARQQQLQIKADCWYVQKFLN
ncbi:GNAT family N-acetyltransferase [Rheinheimera sp.]|uniref:GNAT family N-acetyltransferase n=1 Tax=Rheinheimera sp. TaxID=1869214 RepID=UPI00307E4BAA